VVLDVRYERVREGGVIVSRAILIALMIATDGILGILGNLPPGGLAGPCW
jgi:transposase-like protein